MRRGDYLDQDEDQLTVDTVLSSVTLSRTHTGSCVSTTAVSQDLLCLGNPSSCDQNNLFKGVCKLKQLELVFVQICFNLLSKHFESDFDQRAQQLGRLASDGGGEHGEQEEAH